MNSKAVTQGVVIVTAFMHRGSSFLLIAKGEIKRGMRRRDRRGGRKGGYLLLDKNEKH